jgi:hypothetical protein
MKALMNTKCNLQSQINMCPFSYEITHFIYNIYNTENNVNKYIVLNSIILKNYIDNIIIFSANVH